MIAVDALPEVYRYTFTRHRVAENLATITGPDSAARVARALLGQRETEALAVLLLDTKHHVTGAHIAAEGNASMAAVRVAELFRAAVRLNATAVILAHNHPSGDPTPSPDDLHLTAEAIAAGRLLDIPVLDHVVISDDAPAVSMRDRDLIRFDR